MCYYRWDKKSENYIMYPLITSTSYISEITYIVTPSEIYRTFLFNLVAGTLYSAEKPRRRHQCDALRDLSDFYLFLVAGILNSPERPRRRHQYDLIYFFQYFFLCQWKTPRVNPLFYFLLLTQLLLFGKSIITIFPNFIEEIESHFKVFPIKVQLPKLTQNRTITKISSQNKLSILKVRNVIQQN